MMVEHSLFKLPTQLHQSIILTFTCSRMKPVDKQVWICYQCLRTQRQHSARATANQLPIPLRTFTTRTPLQADSDATNQKQQHNAATNKDNESKEVEQGAMSRRLSEMAEEMMDTGSKSDRKMMKDVGFSEELKKQLEERIAQTTFNAENQQALSEANMPRAAGKGTRDIASAKPWTGQETLHDATLRMLDDSLPKLRSPAKAAPVPPKINLRPVPKKNISPADRIAQARDKTSIYHISQQSEMTDTQREAFRKELKERFTPGARPMPTSLQGLTSLANERIEDAIARGQFKNITRGKGVNVDRDHNANSPFLNTTEYFMNKIIQKQEIVPPWIEKQQELVKSVNVFRSRMRNDWRRHAARMISASGGSVEDQVRRARGYALAEEKVNPRVPKTSTLSSISSDGSLTRITVEERIAAGIRADEPARNKEETPDRIITVTETPVGESPKTTLAEPAQSSTAPASTAPPPPPIGSTQQPTAAQVSSVPTTPDSTANPAPPTSSTNTTSSSQSVLPMPYPYRDPAWERTENAYQTLAVAELNNLTRSYNLMAPKIAQRPYYNLQRELNRCFADVAPSLPDEILERSKKPIVKIQIIGHKEGGVMQRFASSEKFQGHEGIIRDEDEKKGYGFKQFWRDLFAKEEKRKEKRAEEQVA